MGNRGQLKELALKFKNGNFEKCNGYLSSLVWADKSCGDGIKPHVWGSEIIKPPLTMFAIIDHGFPYIITPEGTATAVRPHRDDAVFLETNSEFEDNLEKYFWETHHKNIFDLFPKKHGNCRGVFLNNPNKFLFADPSGVLAKVDSQSGLKEFCLEIAQEPFCKIIPFQEDDKVVCCNYHTTSVWSFEQNKKLYDIEGTSDPPDNIEVIPELNLLITIDEAGGLAYSAWILGVVCFMTKTLLRCHLISKGLEGPHVVFSADELGTLAFMILMKKKTAKLV